MQNRANSPEPTGFREELHSDVNYFFKNGGVWSTTLKPADSIHRLSDELTGRDVKLFSLVLANGETEHMTIFMDSVAYFSEHQRVARIPIYEADVMERALKLVQGTTGVDRDEAQGSPAAQDGSAPQGDAPDSGERGDPQNSRRKSPAQDQRRRVRRRA